MSLNRLWTWGALHPCCIQVSASGYGCLCEAWEDVHLGGSLSQQTGSLNVISCFYTVCCRLFVVFPLRFIRYVALIKWCLCSKIIVCLLWTYSKILYETKGWWFRDYNAALIFLSLNNKSMKFPFWININLYIFPLGLWCYVFTALY